jgi:hypothetical protein
MAKENKKSLIIWAAVALVIGVILGLVITNLSTTGNAKSATEVAPRITLNHNANLILTQKMYNSSEDLKFYTLYRNTKVDSTIPVTITSMDKYTFSYNDSENKNITGGNTMKGIVGTRENPIRSYDGYSQIPYLTNNPTVYSYSDAQWYINQNSGNKFSEKTINPSQFPYPEANYFDFDCQGYNLNFISSEVEKIIYEIDLDYYSGTQYVIVNNIENPYTTTNDSGNFSAEIINQLNDGHDHAVKIDAYLITTENSGQLITNVSKIRHLNCQTGTSENVKQSNEITEEELNSKIRILEEKGIFNK